MPWPSKNPDDFLVGGALTQAWDDAAAAREREEAEAAAPEAPELPMRYFAALAVATAVVASLTALIYRPAAAVVLLMGYGATVALDAWWDDRLRMRMRVRVLAGAVIAGGLVGYGVWRVSGYELPAVLVAALATGVLLRRLRPKPERHPSGLT